MFTFQRGRERVYNYKFSKVSALIIKRISGDFIKEEVCGKFS